ncbi:hypothetical protein CVS40_8161 [Lucilia cuprina]|nr:hypothetical protein CVS40_8161 [Lucilia cuprina]
MDSQNIFDGFGEEYSQEMIANLPRTSFTFNPNENPPSTSSSAAKNKDILEILKNISSRLEKIEETQTTIMQNQSILSNGQGSIVSNQQEIANKLEKLETSILSKPEALAQSKLLMECKVAIKNVESSVCRMTGEKQDKLLDEVASMLPLKSVEAEGEVEQKIESPEFCQAMITYFHKLKGTSEDVSCVIRAVLTDDLLEKYNWEGRWGKQALAKLSLFQKVLQVLKHNKN